MLICYLNLLQKTREDGSSTMSSSSQKLFIVYGIQAGLFACLASVFGKLALSEDDLLRICMSLGERYELDLVAPCYRFSPLVRLGCISLIVISNSLMWLFFTKAMNASSTTAAALAVNSAANFLLTGVAGALLFGETLSWKWAIGTVFIVAGLVCINISTGEEPPKTQKLKTS